MTNLSFAEADFPQKMAYLNEADNFARLYDIRLVEYEADFACLEMQLTPMFLNSQGRLHGSWQAALIMIAAGKAAQPRPGGAPVQAEYELSPRGAGGAAADFGAC